MVFSSGDLDALDFFEFLDADLHLLGLGGLVAEAVDEGFELLDAVALVPVGGFKLGRGALLSARGTSRSCRGRRASRLFQISTILLTVTSRK